METRKRSMRRAGRCLLGSIGVIAAMCFAAPAALAGAVISNGTVSLGVNDAGQLIFDNTGVTYVATGNDGTRAGCWCEGWGAGVGDGAATFQGIANMAAAGDVNGVENVDLVSFTSNGTTATSVTTIDGKLEVTHQFAPAPQSSNLYEVQVSLRNLTGVAFPDVRYTRVMDWDIEPTEFDDLVTILGVQPKPAQLRYSNDDGFSDGFPYGFNGADPFRDPIAPETENADFVANGPTDHGALFDFDFGALAAGATKSFVIYYGAAGTQSAAADATQAVGAEIVSFGQPDPGLTGLPQGQPNTFIFGFKSVGGGDPFGPILSLSPSRSFRPTGTAHTATARVGEFEGAPFPGEQVLFEVDGEHPQTPAPVMTDANGRATFTYTGTTLGTDTITACWDDNADEVCGAGESRGTATVVWDTDDDGDGVADGVDNCPGVPNPGQEDSDDDGDGDACDVPEVDTDGDGWLDFEDNCPSASNPGQEDADGDGVGDACEVPDRDGDGVADGADICPDTPNADQRDTDGDRLGDSCDPEPRGPDGDRDGVLDAVDNCPSVANTDQANGDADPFGNACDPNTAGPPVVGKSVNVLATSGTVRIRPKGGRGFTTLTGQQSIPSGSVIDATKGAVAIVSAAGGGRTHTGTFSEGIFQIRQIKADRAAEQTTDLIVRGASFKSQCRANGKRKPGKKGVVRRLRGDANGRFRTIGRRSTATVRGTVWLTEDRCEGTLTRVVKGRVAVRDRGKKKTFLLAAGKSYLARIARASARGRGR